MAQTAEHAAPAANPIPGAGFVEKFVEADGFRIRYLERGQGTPLVHFHGAGGVRMSYALDLLSEHYRVIAFEVPGFGESAVNEKSRSIEDLARTMAQAIKNLGLDHYNLMGISFGGRLALWTALVAPEGIDALVLVSPAAIRPEGHAVGPAPESNATLMYAHPDRQPPRPRPSAEVLQKQDALLQRLRGPARDPEMERRMGELPMPVLVLFGTEDRMIPPEMGRIYREKIPTCYFILVYDAAHAIDADRPEAFTDVVSDFLERRQQFVVNKESSLIHR